MKKIVITELKEGKVIIGAFKEGCDPFTKTIDTIPNLTQQDCSRCHGTGQLDAYAMAVNPPEDVPERVPCGLCKGTGRESVSTPFEGAFDSLDKVWQEAETHWLTTPKNPAYVEPEKPKPVVAPKATKPARTPKKKASAERRVALSGDTVKIEPAIEIPKTAGEILIGKIEATQNAKKQEELPLFIDDEQLPEDIATDGSIAVQNPSRDETPQAPKSKPKDAKIYLATGAGPYKDVQEALTALGISAEDRPNHNRYDRLSKKLREQIVLK